jgi:UDP-N-acetylmuramoylalanine--D-glutamate ligase
MDLKGKRVLVVGLARTGIATVRFLKGKGSLVSTTETRSKEEMAEAAQALEGMDVRMEWGGHQTETFLKQDLIVLSPGVDLKIEPVQEALKNGIRIISEIELAYHFISVPILAVTGTNGKTTTTLLLGEMMKEDGKTLSRRTGEPLILFADGGSMGGPGGRFQFPAEAIEISGPGVHPPEYHEDHLILSDLPGLY